MENLRDYLASYGMSLHDMPAVLQINKTDQAGAADAATIAAKLELGHLPASLSAALNGTGVLETFSALSRLIMERVGADSALQAATAPLPPSSVAVAENATLSAPLDPAPGERLAHVVPATPAAKDTSPEGPEPEAGDEGCLKVTLVEEAVAMTDGSVRVPLTISLHGQARRFILKVAVEPDVETP